MYKTQNLEKPMMDKVREKHARYKKNAIAFWRKKIVDCYSLQAQAGRSDGQVPYELAQGAGRGCKTIQIEKGGAAKKSRNGDTLGPVELNVGLEQGNQGDQGDRREQDDQGEVSIIIFGMSESSGFQKYSIRWVFQALFLCLCLCRCLCHCLCLCICVL